MYTCVHHAIVRAFNVCIYMYIHVYTIFMETPLMACNYIITPCYIFIMGLYCCEYAIIPSLAASYISIIILVYTIGAATVQSLAGQSSIPASLLSNAINMAASLSNSSSNSILTNSGRLSVQLHMYTIVYSVKCTQCTCVYMYIVHVGVVHVQWIHISLFTCTCRTSIFAECEYKLSWQQ